MGIKYIIYVITNITTKSYIFWQMNNNLKVPKIYNPSCKLMPQRELGPLHTAALKIGGGLEGVFEQR